MDYKNNKGFTLIEMMVVIAVIGILSAAVLAGIAPGRQKARETRIINAVKQVQVLVESMISDSGTYPGNVAVGAADGYVKANKDARDNGADGNINYAEEGSRYIISSRFQVSKNKWYCVDSLGAARSVVTAISGFECPAS